MDVVVHGETTGTSKLVYIRNYNNHLSARVVNCELQNHGPGLLVYPTGPEMFYGSIGGGLVVSQLSYEVGCKSVKKVHVNRTIYLKDVLYIKIKRCFYIQGTVVQLVR